MQFIFWKVASIPLGLTVTSILLFLLFEDLLSPFVFCHSATRFCHYFFSLAVILIIQLFMIVTSILSLRWLKRSFEDKTLFELIKKQFNLVPLTTHKENSPVDIFNHDPKKAIQLLLSTNKIDGSGASLAQFLHENNKILNSTKVGEFLSERDNKEVLLAYMDHFEFTNKDFDDALRLALSKFRLPGESQKIDRVMEAFAIRYTANNPQTFPNHDTAYVLAFAVIMLNTDAHNPSVKKKMTKKEFVQNNRGIAAGKDLPQEYLEGLYDKVIHNEIKLQNETPLSKAVKQGSLWILSRQHVWRKRWVALSNNCLYYYSDPEDVNPKVAIPLVGLAVREYTFHQATETEEMTKEEEGFVKDEETVYYYFEVFSQANAAIKSCKNGSINETHAKYLFRTTTLNEMEEWIDCIDFNILGNPFHDLLHERKSIIASTISGRNSLRRSLTNASNSAGRRLSRMLSTSKLKHPSRLSLVQEEQPANS
eukprot:TRINITY_DN2474_c0_g1_i2.p1 TRINITY_DN2474_c0_g1~~TRINITY_DN2474_c0_g1_i2.p1  ORF type:complete len:480 (-),score=87.63 TRINITY_DN2474_c0_g1_i2:75-1514(-)